MTTNELKSYIDRILGNNIRLLLPSYWWKRAFGVVIDKIDEVENGGSSITVDSELSETSENPVQNKVITEVLAAIGTSMELFAKTMQENDADTLAQAKTYVEETTSTAIGAFAADVQFVVDDINNRKADKTYVDTAISTAITNTLNTPV